MRGWEVCSDGSTGALGHYDLECGFCLLFSVESSVGRDMTGFLFGGV